MTVFQKGDRMTYCGFFDRSLSIRCGERGAVDEAMVPPSSSDVDKSGGGDLGSHLVHDTR
jgi:predicted glycosyltransferase